MKPRPVPPPPPTLIGLFFVTAALAVICGLAMLIANERWLGLSLSTLDPSPFDSYRVPGLVLAIVVGGSQLAAGYALLRRRRGMHRLAILAAAILGGWIAIQALMIGIFWLQPVVFLVALVELGLVASNLPPAKGSAGKHRKRR